jgi:hypothetical protein
MRYNRPQRHHLHAREVPKIALPYWTRLIRWMIQGDTARLGTGPGRNETRARTALVSDANPTPPQWQAASNGSARTCLQPMMNGWQ